MIDFKAFIETGGAHGYGALMWLVRIENNVETVGQIENNALVWKPVEEGVHMKPTFEWGWEGYKILEAMHEALELCFNGRQPVTDVAQLKESLAVERARVDKVLDAHIHDNAVRARTSI